MTAAAHPRDRWIPWYFVLFFVVLIIVDGVMATIAVRTQTGIITEHPYEKGIAYNQTVKAAQDQAALGWKGDIYFVGGAERSGALAFTLQDAKGKALTPYRLTANITRPTQAGMDFSLPLEAGDNAVSFPQNGLWEVRIFASVGGIQYQQSKRIIVP